MKVADSEFDALNCYITKDFSLCERGTVFFRGNDFYKKIEICM